MYKAYAHKKHELHPVDQFMLELCEIPCLSIRIDICLTLWEFPWQYESTCQVPIETAEESARTKKCFSSVSRLSVFYILALDPENWFKFSLSSINSVKNTCMKCIYGVSRCKSTKCLSVFHQVPVFRSIAKIT